MPVETLILVYIIATASFTLSQIAGGGVSLIMIPFLIFMGIPPHVAFGSMKLSTIGSISALYKYHKSKKIDWPRIPLYIVINLVAVFFGTNILLNTEPDALTTVFGVIIFLLLPFIFFKPKWGLLNIQTKKTKKQRHLGHVLYFFIAIVQSAFGAGMGLVTTYIFVTYYGYTLIETHGTRRTALYVLNVSSAIIYAIAGIVNVTLGLVLLAGSFSGGIIGSHIAIKKGNEFVKYFFTSLILISAIRLLFF